EHESRALRERPAGHDRREAAGRSTGDHDLDVVRRAELRDRRGVVRGVRELPEHVLGEPLATVPAREQLTDRALEPREEPAADVESLGADPCSTESDSQGLASSRSPMQYV